MLGRNQSVQTSLRAIAQKAASQKKHRFRDLYRLLNEELLKDCWRAIRKDAAYGVDQVSAQEYEEHLVENIHNLVERLKRKSYRAKLVRRHYIPKGDGQWRPLGIPAVEDKLLQLAVTRILTAIYEQDFLRCSNGYRPNKGALDAVDKLTIKLQFGRYNRIVEADIRGFFNNISHEWMVRMLAERIDDRALLWLIKKWLKAGVLDTDGQVLHPATGTPQGGIVSPILANVYLHYALDLWFERVVKQHCRGEACLTQIRRRFCLRLRKAERGRTLLKGTRPTAAEVRVGIISGENTGHSFQQTPACWQGELRFSGLRVSVGPGPCRENASKAADCAAEITKLTETLHGVGKGNRHLRQKHGSRSEPKAARSQFHLPEGSSNDLGICPTV